MAKASAAIHWGKWVTRRARIAGHATQRELASAVGVTRQHLSKWAKMAMPPARMRPGTEDALARALLTDRRMLIYDWRDVDPEHVVPVRTQDDLEVPWDADQPEAEDLRRRLVAILKELPLDDIRTIFVHATTIELDRMAERRKRLQESLKNLEVAKRTGVWPAMPVEEHPPKVDTPPSGALDFPRSHSGRKKRKAK